MRGINIRQPEAVCHWGGLQGGAECNGGHGLRHRTSFVIDEEYTGCLFSLTMFFMFSMRGHLGLPPTDYPRPPTSFEQPIYFRGLIYLFGYYLWHLHMQTETHFVIDILMKFKVSS